MVNFEVIHMSQFLLELIKEGRLEITGEYQKKVTYHDPCFLGRHNDIYDEPREILRNIPGLTLDEMAMSRSNSLCCGGGGGRVWMETQPGERFSEMKVGQAFDAGAEVLAVACPYCMLMFDDAVLVTGKESVLQIKDISQLLLEAI